MRHYSIGPWRVDTTDKNQTCVRSSHGGLVATCEAGYQAMRDADAKLIAASPELLEACKSAHGFINLVREGKRDINETLVDTIIQAAINKAEGRE